jgi:hypothetical protein
MAKPWRYPPTIRWGRALGELRITDPATGQVHEIQAVDAPPHWRAIAQEQKKADRSEAAWQ